MYLLIIGKHSNCEEVFISAKKKNLKTILISQNNYYPRIDENYLKYIDKIIILNDMFDDKNIFNIIEDLNKQEQIAGVLTFVEYYVPVVARICKEYCLNGLSTDVANRVRNKYLMRKHLQAKNVNIPEFILVDSLDMAVSAGINIGFPNVIKPINMGGSKYVLKNINIHELENNYKTVANAIPPLGLKKEEALLIEEYMDGQEFSVESVVFEERIENVTITQKSILHGRNCFIEVSHLVPADITTDVASKIDSVVKECIRALEIKWAITHCEVKLINGKVKIVEIAGRVAGGNIPRLVRIAKGVNMFDLAVSLAIGEEVNINSIDNGSAFCKFITCSSGKINKIMGVEEAKKLKNIKQIKLNVSEGDIIGNIIDNSGRAGYVIASGKNTIEAINSAESAINMIKINIE